MAVWGAGAPWGLHPYCDDFLLCTLCLEEFRGIPNDNGASVQGYSLCFPWYPFMSVFLHSCTVGGIFAKPTYYCYSIIASTNIFSKQAKGLPMGQGGGVASSRIYRGNIAQWVGASKSWTFYPKVNLFWSFQQDCTKAGFGIGLPTTRGGPGNLLELQLISKLQR